MDLSRAGFRERAGMQSHDVMQGGPLNWYRASFCAAGECVEIAAHADVVIMRNSAYPEAGYIYFSPREFGSFVTAAKAGEFGLAH
jgi:hypothetical protein